MADAERNKLAAKIIKAEMMNDQDAVKELKSEMAKLGTHSNTKISDVMPPKSRASQHDHYSVRDQIVERKRFPDGRVKKFLDTNSSLSQMFVKEKSLTASDEIKMFLKTSSKFSKEDMETKHFSEEIDDSQMILNKSNKRRKQQGPQLPSATSQYDPSRELEICDRCLERQAKHLIVDKKEFVYLALADAKPFLSSLSNAIIRNADHSTESFISASDDHQIEAERMMNVLKSAWEEQGYKCILMETYFKSRKPMRKEFASCGSHFQIHCLPIKEKHFEKARMCFKQALQSSEGEWSLNRKLISTEGRKIQRCLPKGLSHFWVCFGDLTNGFGHVIENTNNFSRYFGLEVLSGLLDRDFNPMRLNQNEEFKEQFERCRNFKILYSKFDSNDQ